MNYTTSKDYEELWRLTRKGKEVICKIIITDAYNTDGIIFTRLKTIDETLVIIEDREHNYLQASNKKDFIERCTISDIEFIPPDEWIKIESEKDLPSDGKKYLVRCDYGTETGIFNNGVFRSQITDITLSGVTHFMPMPKAPEVQS